MDRVDRVGELKLSIMACIYLQSHSTVHNGEHRWANSRRVDDGDANADAAPTRLPGRIPRRISPMPRSSRPRGHPSRPGRAPGGAGAGAAAAVLTWQESEHILCRARFQFSVALAAVLVFDETETDMRLKDNARGTKLSVHTIRRTSCCHHSPHGDGWTGLQPAMPASSSNTNRIWPRTDGRVGVQTVGVGAGEAARCKRARGRGAAIQAILMPERLLVLHVVRPWMPRPRLWKMSWISFASREPRARPQPRRGRRRHHLAQGKQKGEQQMVSVMAKGRWENSGTILSERPTFQCHPRGTTQTKW